MSEIRSLHGKMDAQGVLALAAQGTDPEDDVLVVIAKRGKRSMIYRTSMEPHVLAYCLQIVQHDMLRQFTVTDLPTGGKDGAS
jgi:hypothetical protein